MGFATGFPERDGSRRTTFNLPGNRLIGRANDSGRTDVMAQQSLTQPADYADKENNGQWCDRSSALSLSLCDCARSVQQRGNYKPVLYNSLSGAAPQAESYVAARSSGIPHTSTQHAMHTIFIYTIAFAHMCRASSFRILRNQWCDQVGSCRRLSTLPLESAR